MSQRYPHLQRIAQDMGITLPRIATTPQRWLPFMRAPHGKPRTLGVTRAEVLRAVFRSRKGTLLIGTIVSIIGQSASALVPWFIGKTLDAAIEFGAGRELLIASAMFVAAVTVVAIMDALREMTETFSWVGTSMGTVPPAVAEHLSNNAGHLRETTPSGDIVNAAETDAINLGKFTAIFPDCVASVCSTVLIAVLMLRTSVQLGLVVLIGMPILFVVLTLLAKPLQKRQKTVRDEQGHMTTIASDAVRGLRILRGVGGEATYAQLYQEQSQKVRDASIRLAPVEAVVTTAKVAMPLLFAALIVGQGALLTLDGALTVGQLLSMYGFTTYLRVLIWMFGLGLENGTRAWVAASRVAEVLSQEAPQIKRGCSELSLSDALAADVSLVAPSGQPIVFETGRIHAIVGAGNGAQAAANALLHHLRPEGGEDAENLAHLTIDGQSVPYSDYSLESLRGRIVFLGATPHLFADTLRDNLLGAAAPQSHPRETKELIWREALDVASDNESLLAYIDAEAAAATKGNDSGERQRRDIQLLTAIDLAHVRDAYTSLDGGLDGMLTEGGRNVSGGQRQRLALARTYVEQPPIVLMEDPTSALDAHTDGLIAEDLRAAREGRTTILTTTSPMLMWHADTVHVIAADGHEIIQGSLRDLQEKAQHSPEVQQALEAIGHYEAGAR